MFIRLKNTERVLNSQIGMLFQVKNFTPGVAGQVAHVIDYRYAYPNGKPQIWSIPEDHYEIAAKDFRNLDIQDKINYCFHKYFKPNGFSTGEMCDKINQEAGMDIAMVPDIYEELSQMQFSQNRS